MAVVEAPARDHSAVADATTRCTPEAREKPTVVPTLLFAGAAASLAYAVLFWYRFDYLGHFVAGFGLTTLLTGVLSRRVRVVASVAMSVGLTLVAGLVSELLFFTSFLFDPVDIANLMLGGLLAAACLGTREIDRRDQRALVVVGVIGILLGLYVRFGSLDPRGW